jgi:hypothetical protein
MARVVAPHGLLLFDVGNQCSLALLRPWMTCPASVLRILIDAGLSLFRVIGCFVLLQSTLEALPRCVAEAANAVDARLCQVFPFFGTRIFFLARKETL